MKRVLELYKEKILAKDGESALHLAEVIRRYGKDGWTKGRMEIALGMIRQDLKELAGIKEFDPSKIEEISKRTGVPLSKLGIMAMIMYPEKYLPMDEMMISLSEVEGIKTSTYSEFVTGWKKFLANHREYFDDFLDLYIVLENGKAYESDSSIVEEVIKMVFKVDSLSLDERTFSAFQEVYSSLLPSDRRKVSDSITDTYVRGALTRNAHAILLIDGSNISMVNAPYPDLTNIFKAFELLGKMKEVPWPFKIIFDENLEYKLKGSQKILFAEKFQKHPNVKFHSPADEMILEIARSTHSWILSNDRYLDYPKFNAVMVRFDGKKVWKAESTK